MISTDAEDLEGVKLTCSYNFPDETEDVEGFQPNSVHDLPDDAEDVKNLQSSCSKDFLDFDDEGDWQDDANFYEVLEQPKKPGILQVDDNPFEQLDFADEGFNESVQKLADILNVSRHPNPLFTFRAARQIICERFNKSYSEHAPPLEEGSCGSKLENVTIKAEKIRYLLDVKDMKDFQTKIVGIIDIARELTIGKDKLDILSTEIE